MHLFRFASRLAILGCMIGMSACGGGNASTSTTTSSVSTLTFGAASPAAATPSAQTFTATFSTGTQYLVINHDGSALQNVTYTISGNTAQITAYPVAPATLGSGIFTSTIVITGYSCADASCSQILPGNTETVTATYTIPLDVQYVAPYVGTANTSQSVILRGQGFNTFPVQDVQFGGTSATSFNVVNDTEIIATYPALTANTYAVTVVTPTTSAGPATSQANLVLQNAPAYAATTIAYPSATSQIKRLVYDAERQTLLIARTTSTTTDEIDNFPYASGVWNSGTTSAISGLADIALTANGQSILSLSQTDMSLLDPVTLTTSSTTSPPALPSGDFYKSLAVTNNNYATVTSGYAGSTATPMYLYSIDKATFTQPTGTPGHPQGTPTLNNSTPGTSADGSLVVLAQGYVGASNSVIYKFNPATMLFDAVVPTINQYAVLPALNRDATRIILNGTNVYDGSFNFLGTLPSTTLAVAISPDGTRAYTYDSVATQVLSFDLTVNAAGGAFPQVGTGTTLAGDPGAGVQMVISPDGGDLFLAGTTQIVVQPTPP